MLLLRLREADQREFGRVAEVAMDFHLAQSSREEFYLVIGGRVCIILNESTFVEPDDEFFGQPWLGRSMSSQERVAAFENWLRRLDDAPNLAATTPAQAWQSFWNAFSPVTPHIPLPRPPARPSSI